jgi:hypothetical protein
MKRWQIIPLFLAAVIATSCGDKATGASGIGNPKIEVALGIDFSSPTQRTLALNQSIQDASGKQWLLDSLKVRVNRLDLDSKRLVDSIITGEVISGTWNPSLPEYEVPKGQYNVIQMNLQPIDGNTVSPSFVLYGQNSSGQKLEIRLFWSEELMFRSPNTIDLQTGRHIFKLNFQAQTWFKTIHVDSIGTLSNNRLLLDEVTQRDARWASDLRTQIRNSLSLYNSKVSE